MSAESDLQAAAIKYAADAGCMFKRNFMGPGAETGWPDVEFFSPKGMAFFIEFKAPGGEASARQKHIIGKLERLGFAAHVCDDLEEAKRIIDAYC